MSTITVSFSPQKLVADARKALGALLVFGAAVLVMHGCTGCKPPNAAEIEAAYTAELVHCSSTAATKAEAKECRRQVNTKYGLCEKAEWPRLSPCDE